MNYVEPEPIRVIYIPAAVACAYGAEAMARINAQHQPRDDAPILEEVEADYESDDWGSVQRWRRPS